MVHLAISDKHSRTFRFRFCFRFTCRLFPVLITKTRLFKYTENFTTKKWKFSDKKFLYFTYFLSKHRLWVLGSNAYSQSLFLSRNKKNNVYPCKPQFYYIKVRFKGGQNYMGVFSWWMIASIECLIHNMIWKNNNKNIHFWSETDQTKCSGYLFLLVIIKMFTSTEQNRNCRSK